MVDFSESLTEASPNVYCQPENKALETIGSVGELMPYLEVRLVDDDGNDVSTGVQTGELYQSTCVRNSITDFYLLRAGSPPDHSIHPTTGPGELWIRGQNIMKGYLNNPAATKNSTTSGTPSSQPLTRRV